MKYLKKFTNIESLTIYKNSTDYIRPNVSLVNNKIENYEQRFKNIDMLTNYDINDIYQGIYINKNFHFIETHQYRVQCKFKYYTEQNFISTDKHLVLSICKFEYSNNPTGYRLYAHTDGNIYHYYDNVYKKLGSNNNIIIEDDILNNLTNEYYLTLYSNIRNFYISNGKFDIYYVKITDITDDNKMICHLIPKYDAQNNIGYFEDITDNSKYYFDERSTYRDINEITIYENESEA